MGNFVAVPSYRRSYKVSQGHTRRTSTNNERPSMPIERENYYVYYNSTADAQSSIWNAYKNRRRRKPETNRIKTRRYNIITFLPKNLFDQFHRVANIYFAALIGLNWIPIINAISKMVAFIPLTVILTITAIKDLVEDLKRWRSDVKINNQRAHVYDKTSKQFVECKWEDLSVGQVVRVFAEQTVPADILLLSTTSPEKTCFLDTAAIDGESNLKQKSIPPCFFNVEKAEESSFELQCDPPNDDIYSFCGRILLPNSPNPHPCDNNHVLLRGCVVRTTEHIDGLIVYAGNQTKIIRSSRIASSKHALIEKHVNRDVLCSSVLLLMICLVCAGLSTQWEKHFGDEWRFVTFIVDDPFHQVAGHFFASTLRFVILFQVMVPIALYVSLDIVRVLQMYAISRDRQLKHDRAISCRTFTINEDLGQIGYIFSDKTGTLTQNKLVFKAISIGGQQYSKRDELSIDYQSESLTDRFLTALATCNTCFIVADHPEFMYRADYQPKYQGENADDLVLCQTASDFGVRMISRSAQTLHIRYLGPDNSTYNDRQYEILCLLPFDSARKRMSVIVRLESEIFLFIKGAETALWPHLSPLNDADVKDRIEQDILRFAGQGYRSLLVAYRQLSLTGFEDWYRRYEHAANALENRDEAISEAATEIENELMVAGVTAVEDKLQEGVPNAIATLRCAGIKIWLLTGDKQATALSTAQAAALINIPQQASISNRLVTTADLHESAQAALNEATHMIYYSSQLIEMDQQLRENGDIASDESRTKKTVARMKEVIAAQTSPVSLVVTGDDLGIILKYDAKNFIKAASQCQSVLFCRVSATQKRELVTVGKSVLSHRILAIGDGANDVGMIREAHCGIGVYGREGSQAVASSDFAVDRFDCLRRLLLVHGAWCYTRTSELILFTFMHNCSYVFVVLFHQIFNGFSGAVSLHSMYILLYTSLFTVLPQCAAALFDQHVSAERALHEPHLYKYTLDGQCYRIQTYWLNMVDGIWQSIVIFFVAFLTYENIEYMDALAFGFSIAFSMTLISMIHVLMQTSRIDISLILTVFLSLVIFLAFTLIFDTTCVSCLIGQSPYQASYLTFQKGIFWFTNIFTIVCALLPRFTVKCIYNTAFNPLLKNRPRKKASVTTTTVEESRF